MKPKGISVLSIAAHLPMNGGRIAGARVAYGAMAPTPMRAKSVERALEGTALDESGIAAAVAVAAEGTAAADRRDREHLVSARDGGGASQAPAAGNGREHA